MHQTKKKKKNSWCTSRGPHVLKLANVTTNPCLMWPHYISYVLKLRAKKLWSLRLLLLGQGRSLYRGGGSTRRSGEGVVCPTPLLKPFLTPASNANLSPTTELPNTVTGILAKKLYVVRGGGGVHIEEGDCLSRSRMQMQKT